jgi:hypothetical protein
MNIGKKILSAFVEVAEEKPATGAAQQTTTPVYREPVTDTGKFKQYFDKLFTDANLPGPDYFEFSKMINAMNSIPDEKARYSAAFAGLSVQGLDREKLLATASQYLQLLDQDAVNFHATVNTALREKVQARQQEMENKNNRIRQLSKEITELQQQITVLQKEVAENEEKIRNSSGGYEVELENMKNKISADIEKIRRHIS